MPYNVTISDDVWEALKALAEPLVDDVNTVLRRQLGLPTPDATDRLLRPATPLRAVGGAGNAGSPRWDLAPSAPRQAGKKKAKQKQPRAPRGSILPESAYEEPILRAVRDLGGKGASREVVERVGELLAPQFTEADRQRLRSGDVRWKNRVQFVRLKLIQAGQLKKDSPRGLWELTPEGLRRAEKASQAKSAG